MTTRLTSLTTRRRRITAATAAAAVVGLALTPAALAAGTQVQKTYQVPVAPMALAQGHTVTTRVTVSNPESTVSDWWSKATVAKVVRKGINGGYQSPYQAQGFSCTPTITGQTTRFTCKLQGADVPTTVTLKFNVVYRGDTASG